MVASLLSPPVPEVQYQRQGRAGGDVVVLVHGTSGSWLHWALVAPSLTDRFDLVLPDLPDPGGDRLELPHLVDGIAGLVDEVGEGRPVHLGGWSLGAVVAAAVAAEHPAAVRSLALVCGWATSDAYIAFQLDLWRRLLEVDLTLFIRHAFTIGFSRAWWKSSAALNVETAVALSAATVAPGAARQAELDTRIDIADRLAAIAAPTLVVGATGDRVIPVEHSRALAGAIAGATLVEVEGNHLLPQEEPALLAGLLADFFTLQGG
jgi:3-oxoadipate enol-lactonase